MEIELVGRDQELTALTGWLDDVSGGSGRLVVLSGEAGIGKSRLVSALADHARNGGSDVLSGRTTEQEGAPAYWPWMQVLTLLDARNLLEEVSGVDPESERFARFESVAAALTATSEKPVLVVLEDMHRADLASLHLLTYVAEHLAVAPALLVVTCRPSPVDQVKGFAGILDELRRLPHAQRIELPGLGEEAVAVLLGGDLGSRTVAEVCEATDGNPLFVGELARHLAAGRDLATVPRSISDSVRLRVAERSPACVEVIQVGAVIGRTFAAGLVATATRRAALACLDDLDEAVAAGLIEPTGTPGEFRFVHALVRDAVEATLGAAELPARHQQVAEAIAAYEGENDEVAAELARHWDVASALGDRATAAHWCERAAVVADQRLAWEEASRLFDRSLELSGPTADEIDQYRRLLGSARTRLHCDELTSAVSRSIQAADAARRADRADLAAEALLILDGRALPSPELRHSTENALEHLPVDDHGRRARLHGQLTHLAYYLDQDAMAPHCERAEAEAALVDDSLADIAAIRARHALCYGPEHAAARLELAGRLGHAARSARRPSVALWEPLWRIDALVELGRLPEAVATIPLLRQAVDAAGAPIARWHLARVEAALAQAAGRFDEALEHGDEARRLFAHLEDAYAAHGIWLGFRTSVEMHTGWTAELAEQQKSLDLSFAPAYLSDMPLLAVVVATAGAGDLDRARADYERLSPLAGWNPSPSIWLHVHTVRLHAAARLGVRGDLQSLLDVLDVHRGLHVATGGGVVSYLGPVELWLGVGAAALERWDRADTDLSQAGELARVSGAPAFAVHADVERASVLITRGGRGDAEIARSLLEQAGPEARRLGMPDFVRRIEEMLAGLADEGPLSRREMQVAGLVAEGRTNKAIATELYLSERTVQNHVQHILTKLGFTNRTQIAAWFQTRQSGPTPQS